MVLTPHFLAGAAIATRFKNPFLAFALAFLSHYFLDIFPHQEYSIKNIEKHNWKKSGLDILKLILDIAFGLVLIFIFLKKDLWRGFGGAFWAALPDGFAFLFFLFPKNKIFSKIYIFHKKIPQSLWETKIPFWGGILTQIIVIILSLWFLK